MPFLETLGQDDEEVLDILYRARRGSLRQLLADPVLKGGFTDGMKGLVAFADLRVGNPNAASLVEGLPWVQDGEDSSEQEALYSLWRLANTYASIFEAIIAKPWVRDGLSSDERSAVEMLAWLYGTSQNQRDIGYTSHHDLVLTIPDMPFMETIESIDVAALASMRKLLQSENRDGYLQHVLSKQSAPRWRQG